MPRRSERGVLAAAPLCLAHGPPRAVPSDVEGADPFADHDARRVRDEMLYLAALCDRELSAGALSRAGQLAQAVVDREQPFGETDLATPFYVWGVILAERAEPAAAVASFEIALDRAEQNSHLCCSLLTRALMAGSLPELSGLAPPILDEDVPDSLQRTLLGQRLLEIRAATALRRGDPEDAARLAARLGEPHRSLLAAKLHVAAGDMRAALAALQRAELVSTRHRLDGLLIRARCASTAGERGSLVREAGEVGEPDHYKRRFVDQGAWGSSVLRCIATGGPTPYASELVVALEGAGSERPQHNSTDELTPREWEVLGHLGTRLSLPEIGTVLFISPNTVKSHVRSIYQKLGVRNRLEADEWQRAKAV